MCKISQLENYELSLMVKMKLWTRSLVLSVMILVVSKSIFWHLQVQIVWEGAVEPTGSFPDTSGSLWIRFWYLSDKRYVFWHFRSLCHFGPNWESLVISIQFGYIWYPKGYVNSMAYVTRPHDWRISVACGRKTLWEKISSGSGQMSFWVDSFWLLTTKRKSLWESGVE